MTKPKDNPSKRGPKPSGRRALCLGVRLYPDELRALDKLLARTPPPVSRSGLAAGLIAQALEREGLIPKPG